jgi:hypothetical protein
VQRIAELQANRDSLLAKKMSSFTPSTAAF